MTGAGRSLTASVPDRIIDLSISLSKQPDEVFRYFTEETFFGTWLTARARVEPEPGNRYELFWERNDRENNSTTGCRITTIHRPHQLSFQWRSPAQFKVFANGADPLTLLTVAFVTKNSGTTVHLIHSGWRSSPEWEAARVWQERAWKMAFDALAHAAGEA